MKIRKAEYSHIGGRKANEDNKTCEILSDSRVYAIIADGLGGHGDGHIASQIALKQLSQCRTTTSLPTESQITEWFRSANSEILLQNKSEKGMRTTAVFLAIDHDQAVWAHSGDSRLYHFYNGQLVHYTCDHSVPQIQVMMGEITRDQIPFSPDRNKILRSLGNEKLEVEIHPVVPLQPGRHAFLLCTDGFWEYLMDIEICLDLYKSSTPEEWLSYLRCRGDVRKNLDADNNTVVAIFIDL